MQRFSRLLNEIAVVCSREYLSSMQKIRMLIAFNGLRLLHSVGRSSTSIRFMGFSVTAPSFANFLAIAREVFVFGDYFFNASTPAPVIIDCGANIGMSTLFFKWLYPQARITAFEPSPVAVAALRKNILDNVLTDVSVVEAAASGEEGTIKFWEQESKPGSSTAVKGVYDRKAEATV